jgi:hypothetical protein
MIATRMSGFVHCLAVIEQAANIVTHSVTQTLKSPFPDVGKGL